MITKEYSKIIDELIRQNRSFAIWRVPGDETIHFRMQSSGSACLLTSLEELNGRSGFVIAPFHISQAHPVVLIQPDCFALPESLPTALSDTETVPVDSSDYLLTEEEEKKNYADRFTAFMDPLHKGIQDKLVLSRKHVIGREACFSAGRTFEAAVQRYIYSYVYLCHTPQLGTWMGSTPEILLSGKQGQWQTVALAGTQPICNGRIPQQWDDKNWREQQLVAFYIRRQLASLGITPEEKGPYAIRAGEVSHLKSDFQFQLSDNRTLGNLLSLLHPTPAVCGLPKREAYRFILEQEGYDRSYYSGFIGELNLEGKTDLYVNLRCMQIGPTTCTLFAGGGLLASSVIESEWQETNDKLETMGRLLH